MDITMEDVGTAQHAPSTDADQVEVKLALCGSENRGLPPTLGNWDPLPQGWERGRRGQGVERNRARKGPGWGGGTPEQFGEPFRPGTRTWT